MQNRQGQKKKKKRGTVLLDFFIALCAIVAIGAGTVLLLYLVIFPKLNSAAMDDIHTLYYNGGAPASATASTSSGSGGNASGLASAKKLNAEIVGWVKYPGTVIDYPVVQSPRSAPEYYLKRNYKKEYTNHGSIFLQSGTDPVKAKSLLLYGHNMRDGQMFHAIANMDYAQLRAHPVLEYDNGSGFTAYKIFSLLRTNTRASQGPVFNYTNPDLATDEAFLQFGYELAIRSLYRFPVDVQAGDQLLLFSTCSYEFDDFRTVLAARRLRPGESKTVDQSLITQAGAQTLYPDCWYPKNGGWRPDWPATYAQAKQEGKLPW